MEIGGGALTELRENQMVPLNRAGPRGGDVRGFAVRAELHATLALAAPLAAANLAQMAMAVTNTVMVGRLGALPLAAAGLGGMLYFTGGVMLQGVLSAVAPLAAYALGAGDRHAAGRVAGAAPVLAVLLALPFVAVLASLDMLFRALGYDAALAAEIGGYLRALAWGGPAFLGFAVLRSLLAALSHTRSVMAVVLICVAGNAMLNWVLIFGRLGAPPLGAAGSGYASAINQWLMLGGLGLCIRIMPRLAALRLLRNAVTASRIEMGKILRLGLPIGGMRGIEVGVFMTAGILMGLLGPAALGAHQLVLNCAGITFMVPLGIAQAATVRVAGELGTGRAHAARRAGLVALALGIVFMGMAAVVLWTAPEGIIAAYVDIADPANLGDRADSAAPPRDCRSVPGVLRNAGDRGRRVARLPGHDGPDVARHVRLLGRRFRRVLATRLSARLWRRRPVVGAGPRPRRRRRAVDPAVSSAGAAGQRCGRSGRFPITLLNPGSGPGGSPATRVLPARGERVGVRGIRLSMAGALIRLARQVEEREGAVHMRCRDWPRRGDIRFVERRETGDAEQCQTDRDLVFEDFEQAHDARTAGRGQAIDIQPADRDRVRTQDHRLHDVSAAADPAVDDDARLAADRLDDFRQDVDRAEHLVELAAAVVRDIDAIDAELDRTARVLDGGDAFQD